MESYQVKSLCLAEEAKDGTICMFSPYRTYIQKLVYKTYVRPCHSRAKRKYYLAKKLNNGEKELEQISLEQICSV